MVIEHGAAERRKRHGLTIVYTGNGKGKTTAAIGLVVRAVGNRMRVFFLQFIKGAWKSGERAVLRGLPGVDLEVTGRGFTIEALRDPRIPMDDHVAAAAHGWRVAQTIVGSGDYDVVVLDEVLGAVTAGLVPLDELIEMVRAKPPALHLVLTGRNAPAELIEVADLVSEVQPIKHPFDKGIKAQRGIEF
ncbi:MAG TPA: cob(I)yrinic acid a,c-diamide adenosyltransferase [Chloroflexota bacterium]|nr:cob(I)yrinic acid a,c-diamide adenosyltransferase [Chloroflexota bacterium]